MCNRQLSSNEGVDFVRLTRTAVVKIAQTHERLLDESVLLMHRA
jgi:hypothetical protein